MIVLVALLVCLIPTTIGALLSAIGIAGMDRLVQRNVLAMSGRAVEAAGDCPRSCSTRPARSRSATARPPSSSRCPACTSSELADAAQLVEPGRRDARGPLDRRAGQGALRPRERELARRDARAVHRADAHERRRHRRPHRSARAPPTRCGAGSRSAGGTVPADARRRIVDGDRRAAAARRWSWPRTAARSASST